MFLSRYFSIGIIILTISFSVHAMEEYNLQDSNSICQLLQFSTFYTTSSKKNALRSTMYKLTRAMDQLPSQNLTNTQISLIRIYDNKKAILRQALALVMDGKNISAELANQFNIQATHYKEILSQQDFIYPNLDLSEPLEMDKLIDTFKNFKSKANSQQSPQN